MFQLLDLEIYTNLSVQYLSRYWCWAVGFFRLIIFRKLRCWFKYWRNERFPWTTPPRRRGTCRQTDWVPAGVDLPPKAFRRSGMRSVQVQTNIISNPPQNRACFVYQLTTSVTMTLKRWNTRHMIYRPAPPGRFRCSKTFPARRGLCCTSDLYRQVLGLVLCVLPDIVVQIYFERYNYQILYVNLQNSDLTLEIQLEKETIARWTAQLAVTSSYIDYFLFGKHVGSCFDSTFIISLKHSPGRQESWGQPDRSIAWRTRPPQLSFYNQVIISLLFYNQCFPVQITYSLLSVRG